MYCCGYGLFCGGGIEVGWGEVWWGFFGIVDEVGVVVCWELVLVEVLLYFWILEVEMFNGFWFVWIFLEVIEV